eukprot:COSAG02_NODE_19369_length_885_cov_1.288804_1_plen_24_part_10
MQKMRLQMVIRLPLLPTQGHREQQ